MREIFDRQAKLNEYTLRNIGVRYDEVLIDPDLKSVWIENYRKALSAELAELVREVRENGVGSRNGVIEIVDMLHFLVSISQLAGLEPPEISIPKGVSADVDTLVVDMFLGMDRLQNSVKWKWWAKGGGYKPEMAREACHSLWMAFGAICGRFELDFDTMKRVYIEKNEVNFRRQDAQYNEDTKTEADNEAIRV
jgi:dimeric dUTPase (all-alpha-NTP-PPase superfamily)